LHSPVARALMDEPV